MRLRLILFVLSLLAFFSASTGGYLYYSSLKESAFRQAEQQAVTRLEMIRKNLSSSLSEHIKPCRTLAGLGQIERLFINRSEDNLADANRILDHFNTTLKADVCYLMDPRGTTIASSNRNADDRRSGRF